MSNHELLAELAGGLAGLMATTARVIVRSAQILEELTRRGVAVDVRCLMFAEFLPKVSRGVLSPKAVAAFSDVPRVIQLVAKFAVEEQERLADGERIEVLTEPGRPTVPLTVREMYDRKCTHAVLGGRVLTVAQQETQLLARTRRPARKPVKVAPVKEVPSEEEIDKLVWYVNEQLAVRQLRLSARTFVDLAIAANWGPLKRK